MGKSLRVTISPNWQGATSLETLRRGLLDVHGSRFSSVLPGGLAAASFKVPWPRNADTWDFLSYPVSVWDGATRVWWGRVSEILPDDSGGMRTLSVTAQGPWARAANIPYTGRFDSSWTAGQVIQSIVFGNVPDVMPSTLEWESVSSNLPDVAFTDTTVQEAVTRCLRYGDDQQLPWTIVFLPPCTRHTPQNIGVRIGGFDYAGTWTEDGTSGATRGGSLVYAASVPKHRPFSGRWGSFLFGAAAGSNAYVQVATGDVVEGYAGMWVYCMKFMEGVNYTLLTFGIGGPTFAYRAQLKAEIDTYRLSAQNGYTGTWYQAGATKCLTKGAWHHVALGVKISATVGFVKAWLDGVGVINSGNINTYTDHLNYLNFGVSDATPDPNIDRVYYGDSLMYSATLRPGLTDFVHAEGTTGCRALMFKRAVNTDTATYPDFWVDPGEVQFNPRLSTDKVANLLILKFSNSGAPVPAQGYVPLVVDDESAQRHGTLAQSQSATELDWNEAVDLSQRIVNQRGWPQPMATGFKMTRPPRMHAGGRLPLMQIRAGMTFRVRGHPEYGLMDVGGCEWSQGSGGQPDSVMVTPDEPTLDLFGEIARKEARAWT